MIVLQTGSSTHGSGGSIKLKSGDGGGMYNGGDIGLTAGQTSAQGRKAGRVSITGGEGSSAHTTDGGDGGDIDLMGGEAKGESDNDNGGSVTIRGGTSFTGYGGSLKFISGQSTESSSGDVREFCPYILQSVSSYLIILFLYFFLHQCLRVHRLDTKTARQGH